jgi:hypothetical protein
MWARLAAAPVQLSATRVVAVAMVVVALSAALIQVGALARSSGSATAGTTPDSQHAAALHQRYLASVAELNALLSARDANPTMAESPSWRQQFSRVGADLASEYAELQATQSTAESASSKACLENAYRLTAEGASLLDQGFQTDGHGAYYYGSHGNWDLNLGQQQLRQCGTQ